MKRRRERIRDKFYVGRSTSVPFVENESWDERHRRRKRTAVERKPEVEEWCREHKWFFRTSNNNHHWIFITEKRKMIEWFPSSGKFGIGKQWHKTFHVHDVDQLLQLLEECVQGERQTTGD